MTTGAAARSAPTARTPSIGFTPFETRADVIARDVLLFASDGEARPALQRWATASDDLSLVLPFGVEPEQLHESMQALAPHAVRDTIAG